MAHWLQKNNDSNDYEFLIRNHSGQKKVKQFSSAEIRELSTQEGISSKNKTKQNKQTKIYIYICIYFRNEDERYTILDWEN